MTEFEDPVSHGTETSRMSAGTADHSARTVGKQRAMDVGPHCLQSRDQPNGTVLSTLNLGLLLTIKQSRTFSWT